MKEYLVEESIKEKKALMKEKENLMHEMLEMKKLTQVFEQLDKCTNKTQFAI